MVNPFVTRQQPNGWVVSLSIVLMLVGMLVSMTWITEKNRQQRLSRLSPDLRSRLAVGDLDLSEEYSKLQEEVNNLRAENTRLQEVASEGNNASKEINESLKQMRLFAGLTDVEGEGLTVTLTDSKKSAEEIGFIESAIIHDTDVLRVVNELWSAGAEAIAVNGIRVGPATDFRCVGPTILVDQQRIASPVTINAIGDSKTLFGALTLPGGIIDDLRMTDPQMAQLEPAKKLFIPAWAGLTSFKFAKVPEPKAEDEDKEEN